MWSTKQKTEYLNCVTEVDWNPNELGRYRAIGDYLKKKLSLKNVYQVMNSQNNTRRQQAQYFQNFKNINNVTLTFK